MGDSRQRTRSSAAPGPLGQQVLEQLWRLGPSTVREIRDSISDGDPDKPAYTTVLTILVRLHRRGLVGRTRDGRQFRYSAAVDERGLLAELGRRDLGRLIERYGAESLAGFASDLIGADSHLVQQLEELADLGQDPAPNARDRGQ